MRILVAFALIVAIGCGGGAKQSDEPIASASPEPAAAAGTLTLQSTAFAEGGAIPKTHSCDGAGMSPPLRWSGVPAGTKELALLVEDPDAPRGTFVHWVIYGIVPEVMAVGEGGLPAGAAQGKNGAGRTSWAGPCPPKGPAHHYVFTLIAVSKPFSLQPGAGIDEVRAAARDSTLAEAKLTGTYARA